MTAQPTTTPSVDPVVLGAVTEDMVREYAVHEAVCVRPLLRQVTDRDTGQIHKLVIPCGATREYLCPPCAAKTRRLRMQQCREGWHLADDPLDHPADERVEGSDASLGEESDVQSETSDEAGGVGTADGIESAESGRRVRSTRRRPDAVDLPRVPAEQRTVGRTFTAPDGTVYRPSMFVTLTLGSYGRVVSPVKGRTIPGAGSPVNPDRYDYRRAALEALHFPKLFDRWVQNLRRCAGYVVQYFGAIEPQRRLAPHIHVALRGAIPRRLLREVTAATYLQLWWPAHDQIVFDEDELPWWDATEETYRCPWTGFALPTWQDALDDLDAKPDAKPALVMRFGTQADIHGIIAPSADADRSIRYLTKYLTKDVAETYGAPDGVPDDPAYERHVTRLWHELLILPCSPECSNWLRYGIQPKDAGPGLDRGACPSKAHSRECLGLGGRRVQVSRHWSGKTLGQHRADRAEVVRQVLTAAGITAPEADRLSTTVLAADGKPRFVWEDLRVRDHDYVTVVMGSVIEARRWRLEYETAKTEQAARAGPPSSPPNGRAGVARGGRANSATTPRRPPDHQPTKDA